MDRKEQIIQAATEYDADNPDRVQAIIAQVGFEMGAEWADAHPDIDVRTMAAWRGGYKEAIERACEWLDNELPKYIMEGREGKPYISVAMVDDFKKAMKYESK